METPVTVRWDGPPMQARTVYSLHDWSAVEEAVRMFSPADVDLAIHPNASLRFADEFVKELKTGCAATKGYLVINPEIAYCKSEVFQALQPHVKALGEWAQSIGSEIDKVHSVVREMLITYSNATRHNIFPIPSPEAQVVEPCAKDEPVYLLLTGQRGLDLIEPPARKHFPELPERCTSIAEIASAQPSEAAAQTELYKLNLQFLQGKLKLLGSFEEQVKKIHFEMNELLLGTSSMGSARTVMKFVDVDMTGAVCMSPMQAKSKKYLKSPSTTADVDKMSMVTKTADINMSMTGKEINPAEDKSTLSKRKCTSPMQAKSHKTKSPAKKSCTSPMQAKSHKTKSPAKKSRTQE